MAYRKMATNRPSFVLPGLVVLSCLAAISVAAEETVSPPGGDCESELMQGLFTCFTRSDVAFNSFLWVAGNGTGGIPPANTTAFREQMCGSEDAVVQCVLGSLHALVGTPECQDAEGMETLLTVQVRSIFDEYDTYCAHECRQTLEDEMKSCYTDLKLNPDLFMSANQDGAILGKSESTVDEFCSNKDALVTCLTQKRDACPESPYVLQRLGLDLDVLSTGIDRLCRNQTVYLSSLTCFEAQSRRVEKCQEDNHLALMRLLARSKAEPVSRETFLNHFCLDTGFCFYGNRAWVQYIRCDLSAWAARGHEACDSPALTLKRDLHCGQIPDPCRQLLSGPVEEVCQYNWAVVTVKVTSPDDGEGHGHASQVKVVDLWVLCIVVLVQLLCAQT